MQATILRPLCQGKRESLYKNFPITVVKLLSRRMLFIIRDQSLLKMILMKEAVMISHKLRIKLIKNK